MTHGASPKARLLELIDTQRKTLRSAETQEEYVDPGSLMIAEAVLTLAEVELLVR